MNKELDKPNQKTDLAKERQLFLLNLDNGRVLPWSPLLAVRPNFVDCTIDGQPINPKDVPGDHPWIKQSTENLRDRMANAGQGVGMSEATVDHMLEDMGRQLTEDAEAKFKSLAYKRAQQLQLEDQKSADQVGATVRINNKIDAMVAKAKLEIRQMAFEALLSHGFKPSEAYQHLI